MTKAHQLITAAVLVQLMASSPASAAFPGSSALVFETEQNQNVPGVSVADADKPTAAESNIERMQLVDGVINENRVPDDSVLTCTYLPVPEPIQIPDPDPIPRILQRLITPDMNLAHGENIFIGSKDPKAPSINTTFYKNQKTGEVVVTIVKQTTKDALTSKVTIQTSGGGYTSYSFNDTSLVGREDKIIMPEGGYSIINYDGRGRVVKTMTIDGNGNMKK